VAADLADACAELAELCQHLPDALERDNGGEGGTHAWHGILVVNADVLSAIDILSREIPALSRETAAQLGETAPRTIDASLRQFPRYAERSAALGRPDTITAAVFRWLKLTKRALGLRKPDTTLPHPCPWAETAPDDHGPRETLILVGAEGFLRPDRDGLRVEWVAAGRIYCPDCGASWSQAEWPLLERILEMAAA
jgi:hypothetical protein